MAQVRLDNEITFPCATCGKPGVLREMTVTSPNITQVYRVSYETHADGANEQLHHDAINRMAAFYQKLFDVIEVFEKLPETERVVSGKEAKGRLGLLEFATTRPTACMKRAEAQPVFTLKSFGVDKDIILPKRDIDSISLDALLTEVIPIAAKVVDYLKQERDEGLY